MSLVVLGIGTAAAAGGSGISGVWLADLSSQSLPDHPDIYLVSGGQYRCDSCEPRRAYPADGRMHAIPGDPDFTAESVTVLSPRSIRTRIVGPSRVRETVMTVAPDGKTALYVSLDTRPGVKGPLRTEYLARRVAAAPPGANAVSGTWQGVRYVSVPEQLRTTELRVGGGRFTYAVPIGVHYTATINGPAVLVQTPYGGDMKTAVRRIDDRTFVETRTRNGSPILERTFALSPDGRMLTTTSFDPVSNTRFSITSHRKAG